MSELRTRLQRNSPLTATIDGYTNILRTSCPPVEGYRRHLELCWPGWHPVGLRTGFHCRKHRVQEARFARHASAPRSRSTASISRPKPQHGLSLSPQSTGHLSAACSISFALLIALCSHLDQCILQLSRRVFPRADTYQSQVTHSLA